ncbi:hypothetical protein JTB14_021065 [Gonioctena quinquepunctata]|nr:hypothetical protein JTB14_021065 [Gonioctena quinquepunctata]
MDVLRAKGFQDPVNKQQNIHLTDCCENSSSPVEVVTLRLPELLRKNQRRKQKEPPEEDDLDATKKPPVDQTYGKNSWGIQQKILKNVRKKEVPSCFEEMEDSNCLPFPPDRTSHAMLKARVPEACQNWVLSLLCLVAAAEAAGIEMHMHAGPGCCWRLLNPGERNTTPWSSSVKGPLNVWKDHTI